MYTVRKFEERDLDRVMSVWLSTNIKAHSFINKVYWEDSYDMVRKALPNSELYVCKYNGEVVGFIGLTKEYIEGIFVEDKYQNQGSGKSLINKAKELYKNLNLTVYKLNKSAVNFYLREGFIKTSEEININIGAVEYEMQYKN